MAKKENRFSYLESVIASVEDRYDRSNEPRSIYEIASTDFGEKWEDIRAEYEALVKKRVSETLAQ